MLTLLLTWMLILPLAVQAEGENVSYSVEALIPENQIDQRQSYFDLNMKPNQKQELAVLIHNNEHEEITVLLSVNNATTNSNGLVIYEEKEEFDPSLKVPLNEILRFKEEEVTIPAGKSKTVTAELEMPEEEYDGIILGGFQFEKVMEEEEASEGVNIQNKYVYVIGVQLSENRDEVLPDLHLNSIRPNLVNHRTAVVANIQNSEPVLIKNMKVNASVYKKGKKDVLKEKKQEEINMAPNSNMDIIIDWDNKALEPGTYLLEMEALHEEEIWKWKEEFVIEKEDAKDLNKNAIELDDNKMGTWLLIGIIILLIVVIILLIYIRKLKSKQNHIQDENDDSTV